MPENPKCPHCNAELECDDVYDLSYDSEGMTEYKVGHCPKCDKDFQWQSSAVFIQWANTDLREV